MQLHIVILAAGKGTRMRSNIPKVLHCLGGKPMLERVINTAQSLQPEKIHVVFGDGGKLVQERLAHLPVNWIEQKEQLGTGHAVLQVLPHIPEEARVLILCGDVPLIATDTLKKFLDATKNDLGLITVELENPAGFGRILRDDTRNVVGIVEHKDATEKQLQIKEINSGIILAPASLLKKYLPKLNQQNSQGEYYLTDVIKMTAVDKFPVIGFMISHAEEVAGINDKRQLANLERYYQKCIAQDLMLQGVTLMDPARFDVRGEVKFGMDIIVDVNNVFEGKVAIGANTVIGPNNFLKNAQIGNNVEIRANCVIEDAIIEDNCIIGPFARVRPGSHIQTGAHVGNFVEVKNTKLGKNSKANHLTYLGDAVIGDNVNIGAGTITCNYDGANKYQTIIEDGVFVGSDVQLIAPVRIGKNATIGAGSTIAQDVPAEKLTVCRAKNQITFDSWQRPMKK